MTSHFIAGRWLPEGLWEKTWVDLEDPTALAVDDWVFDHNPGCYYAGQITLVREHSVNVKWYKSEDNEFESIESFHNVMKYWWADPCQQED